MYFVLIDTVLFNLLCLDLLFSARDSQANVGGEGGGGGGGRGGGKRENILSIFFFSLLRQWNKRKPFRKEVLQKDLKELTGSMTDRNRAFSWLQIAESGKEKEC